MNKIVGEPESSMYNFLVNERGSSKDKFLDRIEEVLVALRRVIRATDLHSKHLAKTTGLTAPQILLLQTIRDKGEVTIGELANGMSLSQATVTTILDRLEKRNLVFRERSREDKRKVHAYLTEEGHNTLKEAPIPLQDHFARQFSDLQEWEQTMIISSLQRVAQMMDAQHIDASPVLDVGLLDRQGTTIEKHNAYPDKEDN
jgi:DNA-binding MarR family transcriptional regulator